MREKRQPLPAGHAASRSRCTIRASLGGTNRAPTGHPRRYRAEQGIQAARKAPPDALNRAVRPRGFGRGTQAAGGVRRLIRLLVATSRPSVRGGLLVPVLAGLGGSLAATPVEARVGAYLLEVVVVEPVEDPVGQPSARPVEEADVPGVRLEVDRDLAVAAIAPHRDLGRYDVGIGAVVVGAREGRVPVREHEQHGGGTNVRDRRRRVREVDALTTRRRPGSLGVVVGSAELLERVLSHSGWVEQESARRTRSSRRRRRGRTRRSPCPRRAAPPGCR